ncbi:MAG: hypothetical protein Q9184_007269 [Pyrenodesmia sp. 2 TL-2023]
MKDVVRVVLEHHDQIKPNEKPGMVHMSVSWVDDEDKKSSTATSKKVKKQVITAHINMKSLVAAWHAWSTINGNRLWGCTLTAEVFPKNQDIVGKVWVPVKWRKPHDLADRFTITSPGAKYFWALNPDGKLQKVKTDNAKSKKRGARGLTSKYPGPIARSSSDVSSCSTLVNASPLGYQSPSSEGLSDGANMLPPSFGWAVDFQGREVRFHQTSMGQTYHLTRYIQQGIYTVSTDAPVEAAQHPTLEDVQRH